MSSNPKSGNVRRAFDALNVDAFRTPARSASVRTVSSLVVALVVGALAWACGNSAPAVPASRSPGPATLSVSNLRSWQIVPVPEDVQLLEEVACPSELICIAAGSDKEYRALIIFSIDRGRSWRRSAVPANLMGVTGLACSNGADCYAITTALDGPPRTHLLLKSKDGGATWSSSMLPIDAISISCWDAGSCLIVGGLNADGTAFKTTDEGLTWTVSNLAQTDATTLNGITCTDAIHCWAVGRRQRAQELFVTSDGGETWTQQLRDYAGLNLQKVYCISISRCLSPGGDRILGTTDGGQNWTREEVPDGVGWLSSVACSSPGDCVAVGAHDFLSTGDGGTLWGLEAWPGGVSLNSVACPSFCVAVGDAGVVVSER